MDCYEHMVISQRRDHGHADEQHGQEHCRHQPVKDARQEGELCAWHARAHVHFPVLAVDTALGSLRSPSRRVNDWEYVADRALRSRSSETAMPSGRTNGSKAMSRAGLVSSLST